MSSTKQWPRTLADVQTGDYVKWPDYNHRVMQVTSVTKTRIRVRSDEYDRDTGRRRPFYHMNSGQYIAVATPDDVAAARVASEKAAEATKKLKIAEAEYNAREDVKLAQRINHIGFAGTEGWLRLGIEKLRRIVSIIDE